MFIPPISPANAENASGTLGPSSTSALVIHETVNTSPTELWHDFEDYLLSIRQTLELTCNSLTLLTLSRLNLLSSPESSHLDGNDIRTHPVRAMALDPTITHNSDTLFHCVIHHWPYTDCIHWR